MLSLIRKISRPIIIPILWVVLTIVLLCIPGGSFPENEILGGISNLDKIVHMCLFGGIVLLWGSHYHPILRDDKIWFHLTVIAALGSILLGILLEYVQFYVVSSRDFSKADIAADAAGVLGAWGWLIIKRKG